MKPMNINDYYSVVKENKFYNRAISRTNLNCKILMKRIGEITKDKYHKGNELSNCYRYIIWNHIMQAYHNDYGIDIIPESCGHMYGYSVKIMHRKDSELSTIVDLTSGSLRIDAVGESFEILDILFKEKDLYITVLKSMKYFEEKITDDIKDNYSNYKSKNLFVNNEIYLSIYQVLTMASCMGLVESWILGVEYIPEYFKEMDRESNLGDLGYFRMNLTILKTFFINKISGDIFYLGKKLIEYKEWCNGDIGQGIKTIMKLNEKNK